MAWLLGRTPMMQLFDRFWEWTSHDPVAFYTSAVALFTAILALSTIGLWIATNRTLRHSRETAERELRAYVVVDAISFPFVDVADKALPERHLHVAFKNA